MSSTAAEVDKAANAPVQNGTVDKAAGAPKKEKAAKAEAGKKDEAATDADNKKISGAELKKQKQAEKAARREKEKSERMAQLGQTATPQTPAKGAKGGDAKKGGEAAQKGGPSAGQAQHKKGQSQGGNLPMRGKPGPGGVIPMTQQQQPQRKTKEVGLFGHLYTSAPKRNTMEGVSKEVHPAVLALGLQMSSFTVCGSNARCVAMLLAFKKAILDYQTPHNTSLARHLTSHYLSPQIDYLKSHRPISVSMGNAIRWLKDLIIKIDPDTPEATAKEDICTAIDTFIRERITVADTAIAATAHAKIRNNSTIVTYAKSSIVEKTLLHAWESGTRFKVVVVDSRPLFEGRNLVRRLANAGVPVTYLMAAAAPHALKDADLVLLGAHAMMANGRLYSRVGTASVAMLAHFRDIPVIVLCESIKFTDRVALDSIVLNEVAPAEQLVPSSKSSPAPAAGEAKKDDKDDVSQAKLENWRDLPNLQLLNILYDVTPAEYVNMVITEYGSLPPSSVPVVHRISTERDVRL
ncbi:IF-2B-domain-containing protein [Aureobasidium subglaciale]|nr:IF-2B-domain-containing protein [Aureobasidium subglaciale]